MTSPYNSILFDVASDATFDALGDAYDGDATKATPTLAQIKQGVRPGRQYAAEYQNWKDREIATVLAAIRDEVQAMPALNWSLVSDGVPGRITRIAYDPLICRWIMVGPDSSNTVYFLGDGSPTANSQYSAITGAGIAGAAFDVAASPAGRIMVAMEQDGGTSTPALAQYNGGTWSGKLVNTNGKKCPSVAFDPNSGLWCCAYRSGSAFAGSANVFTSPDGSTWTARTSPFSGTIGDMAIRSLYGCGGATPNRLVWVANTTSTGWSWATSDDGGVTWTLRGTVSDAGTWSEEPCLAIDGETGEVYFVVLGAYGTHVYRSVDDGVTFDLWRTIASTKMGRMVAKAGLLTGIVTATVSGGFDSKSDVLYAPPSDQVFRRSGIRLVVDTSDEPPTIGVGPTGFLATAGTGAQVWRSLNSRLPAVPFPT